MAEHYGFTCPHCRAVYQNTKAAAWIGRRMRCAKCRRIFVLAGVAPVPPKKVPAAVATHGNTPMPTASRTTPAKVGGKAPHVGKGLATALLILGILGRHAGWFHDKRQSSIIPTRVQVQPFQVPQSSQPPQAQAQRPQPNRGDALQALLLNALVQQQRQQSSQAQQRASYQPAPVYTTPGTSAGGMATQSRSPTSYQPSRTYSSPPTSANPGGYDGSDSTGGFSGSSRPNLLGGSDSYDGNGRSAGYSTDNVFGGRNYYTNGGSSAGYSKPNVSGGFDYYDGNGRPIGSGSPNVFGGQTYQGQ